MIKSFLLTLTAIAIFTIQGTKAAGAEFFVEKYGAKNDGISLNTQAIQRAIDEASKSGGGKVILSAGIYLSGGIQLKDNVTLDIKRGAVLRGSTNPMDYKNIDLFIDATGQSRGECLVGAVDARNVAITGNGTIDGNGDYFQAMLTKKRLTAAGVEAKLVEKYFRVRPFLVRIVRCDGVSITKINMRDPGAWTCHLYQSKNIKIDGISISAHVNRNNDGIDLDSCDGATITNCDINSGDDAICFKTTSPIPCQNVTVSKCRLSSHWGAIKFGTESMGDFKNIRVSDCDVYDTRGGAIKVLSVDGANIFNVRISKIRMTNVDMPIFVRLGERLRTYRNAPMQPIGSIDRLYISGISATTRSRGESRVNPASGILITGTANARIGLVSLQGINITLPGGGTLGDTANIVPELEKNYPEFTHFGVQPAFGINARHIDSLLIKNMSFKLSGKDERKLHYFEDINSVPYEYPALID